MAKIYLKPTNFLVISTILVVSMIVGNHGKANAVSRHKRNVPRFDDPKYMEAFYLNDNFGVTMNIIKAWNNGYTGKNVTICISDPTGVLWTHPDLSSKFVQQGSYDFKDNDTSPLPDPRSIPNTQGNHGTVMAGLAAAKANNGICSVGVAYDAEISAVKFAASGATEDYGIRGSFSFQNNINDILSCSWGPIGFFQKTIGYIKPSIFPAFKQAGEQGRNGKGTIIVFSVGNSGRFNGTCSYDEYITSIYTIGISVVTGKNVRSRQNIRCPAITAVSYARDGSLGIDNTDDLMPACGLQNGCAKTSGSSSAAAAVSSGIMALVLQANPNLGWRDVQHLIARSSSSDFKTVHWITNRAGIKVSDDFGFGLLDAFALTDNAKTWKNVGPHLECKIDSTSQEPIDGVNTLVKTVDTTTWPSSCGGESSRINYLEHVVLVISLRFTLRRNIEINVGSPGGTRSIILRSGRVMDAGTEISNLSTMSLHFWGENPRGTWTIRIRNVKPNVNDNGTLFNWSLKLYGTNANPMASNTVSGSKLKIDTKSGATSTPTGTSSIRPTYSSSSSTKIGSPSTGSPAPTTPNGISRNTSTGSIAVMMAFHMVIFFLFSL